jgi:hypothetical protein
MPSMGGFICADHCQKVRLEGDDDVVSEKGGRP